MPGSAPGSGFEREVAERFGVLPNIFHAAGASPEFHESLWQFAKTAYLDNALQSLFKERLFVHLSRFCEARYCIVRHVAFLAGRGYPAGNPNAAALSVEEIIEFLERPAPGEHDLGAILDRLEAGSALDEDLIDAATVLFLDPANSTRARNALRHALGDENFELLTALLAYIHTAHSWTETHPGIAYEPDAVELLDSHPELARLIQRKELRADKPERVDRIHHRVYNNLQIISSLLGVESLRAEDPRARQGFLEMRNRVHAIASIHAMLRESSSGVAVDLVACARQLVPEIVRLCAAARRIVVEVPGEGVTLDFERAAPWALLLNELVSDICRRTASADEPVRIRVSLTRGEDGIVMTVSDTAPDGPPAGGGILKSLEKQLRAEVKMAPGEVTVTIPDNL